MSEAAHLATATVHSATPVGRSASAAPPPGGPRSNHVNLLRLALALLVVVAHGPEIVDGDRGRELLSRVFHTLSFGELAVDGFFLLSGYLILQSWLGAPRLLVFLRKRVLRIVPAYLVAALLSAFVVGRLGAADPAGYFSSIWWGGLVRSLLMLETPLTPATFAGSHYPSVNGAMWTIHYEFLCYLTAPLLATIGLWRHRHGPLLAVALCFAASAMIQTGLVSWGRAGVLAEVRVLLHFYSFFLAGGCFYFYRQRIVYRPAYAWVALAGLPLCLCRPASADVGVLLFGAYLLFYAAFHAGAGLAWARRLPDVSYGLYLYGWPVAKLLVWYLPGIGPLALVLLSGAAAYGCGYLSWILIEQPALALKTARTSDADKGREGAYANRHP